VLTKKQQTELTIALGSIVVACDALDRAETRIAGQLQSTDVCAELARDAAHLAHKLASMLARAVEGTLDVRTVIPSDEGK
jgi:hypothetical protein